MSKHGDLPSAVDLYSRWDIKHCLAPDVSRINNAVLYVVQLWCTHMEYVRSNVCQIICKFLYEVQVPLLFVVPCVGWMNYLNLYSLYSWMTSYTRCECHIYEVYWNIKCEASYFCLTPQGSKCTAARKLYATTSYVYNGFVRFCSIMHTCRAC